MKFFQVSMKKFLSVVSFAMTINKSHDGCLDMLEYIYQLLYFFYDQLYVAISRVSAREWLKIFITGEYGKETNVTLNVVYKEVFHNL
jgi:ATP-dependent DNA helicase PIF1